MKNFLGKISWIIAVMGVLAIGLSISIIDNYILFYAGLVILIVGIAGTLLTNSKTKEVIWKLLDFI